VCNLRSSYGSLPLLVDWMFVLNLSRVEIWLDGEEHPRIFEWSQEKSLDVETGRNYVKVFIGSENGTLQRTFIVPRDKVRNLWIEHVPNDCEP